jgi:flagellar basal body-associated protein FliL
MQKKGSISILIILEIVVFAVLCVLVVFAATKARKNGSTTTQLQTTSTVTSWMTELTETEDTEAEVTTEAEVQQQTDTFSEAVQDMLDGMSDEEKVSQLFAVSPENLTAQDIVTAADDTLKGALSDYPVGALVYTYTNYTDDDQISALLTDSRNMAAEVAETAPLTIAADDGENAPYSIAYAKTGDMSELATALGEDGGITELTDTDDTGLILNYTVIAVSSDFAKLVKKADIVIWNGDYDTDAVTNFRTDYKYHGVIMVTASGDAAVDAITAGMDMIYMPEGFEETYTAVLDAVSAGDITSEQLDQAVGHILSFKLGDDGVSETDTTTETAGESSEPQDGEGSNNNSTNRSTTTATTQQSTTQRQTTTTQVPTTTQTPATTQQPATTQRPTTTQTPVTTQATTSQPPATTEAPVVTTEAPATTQAPVATTEISVPSVGDGASEEE